MTGEQVDVVTMAAPGFIAGLAMDPGLGSFRAPEQQKEVLAHLAGRPGRMVSLAVSGSTIVGYVALHRVNPAYPVLHELQGIEVTPARRGRGVAGKLLAATFADPVWEDCIVYVTGDPDYWDMAGTGLNAWQYRKVLTRLYASVGFVAKPARNPDILCHVADLFMIRAGHRVPPGWEAWCYPLLGIGDPD